MAHELASQVDGLSLVNELTPELIDLVFAKLSPGEVACAARCLSKRHRAVFADHATVSPATPLPLWAFAAMYERWQRGIAPVQELKQLAHGVAAADQLDCMAWLEQRPEWTHMQSADLCGLLQTAARSGSLRVMRHLLEAGAEADEWTGSAAARAGHLAAVQLLQQHGVRLTKWTLMAAAEGGQLEVLDWAHAQGAPADLSVTTVAARRGDLQVLAWAEGRAPFGAATCAAAAEAGRLEALQWLRARRVPWDHLVLERAQAHGHAAVAAWAAEHGCPQPPPW